MSTDSKSQSTAVIQRGDRLECAACGEVAIWCQCEPFPFTDEQLATVETAMRRERENQNGR